MGRVAVSPKRRPMSATSTGTVPMTTAAWLTLVRAMPAFWSRTTRPNPMAPDPSTRRSRARRRPCRPTSARTGAMAAKRNAANQAGPNQVSESLDSGTVRPQRAPAPARERIAARLLRVMPSMIGGLWQIVGANLTVGLVCDAIFRHMASVLDLIDLKLLEELQSDADRSNVELARLVGLSPAATLHRVRRLKESGIIRAVVARLDASAAGFPLQVYVAVTLQRHDEASHRRFAEAVRAMPEVISADWVTGETDAMLMVVAREVAELQRMIVRLSTRGGAARVMTLLRLEELKPASPLPLEPSSA